MAADQVIGQSGEGVVHGADVARGQQAQFQKGLEAIANTQHQTVAAVEQIVHRFGDTGIAVESANELAGAIWLVAAGESAGQDNHLCVADGLFHFLDGLF